MISCSHIIPLFFLLYHVQFAVNQLLRSLDFSPMLPSEPFHSHLKSSTSSNGRVDQVTCSESPSASSNASSPGALDILQTPSDTSPLAHRLPHIPEFLSDQFRNQPHNAKNGVPFTFNGHNSAQGSSHGLAGKPYEHSAFKSHSSVPRFSTSIYGLPHHSSNTPSNHVFPSTSYPLINQPTHSSSIYATSHTSSTSYQGVFNPFDSDANTNIGTTRLLNNPSPHEDFSKTTRRQGGNLSNNLAWSQSISPSLDYTYHTVPSISSSLYSPPSQRRQPDSVQGHSNDPSTTQFENKIISSFPTQPTYDARSMSTQQRQFPPHGLGTNASDPELATRDMLRNLAIAGLTRHREKRRSISGTSEEHLTQLSSGYHNASPPETSSNSPSSEKQANEVQLGFHL